MVTCSVACVSNTYTHSGKSSRHGFSEDDYVALLGKNPETLFQDESYMKHLRRNATKYASNFTHVIIY